MATPPSRHMRRRRSRSAKAAPSPTAGAVALSSLHRQSARCQIEKRPEAPRIVDDVEVHNLAADQTPLVALRAVDFQVRLAVTIVVAHAAIDPAAARYDAPSLVIDDLNLGQKPRQPALQQ